MSLAEKHEFSIITIVNKENVYQEFKKSLDQQKQVDYELIKINNSNNQFQSARAAYNEASKKATGKYLVFIHPDIRFLDEMSLYDILTEATNIDNFGVVGIAGSPVRMHKGHFILLTTLKQGKRKESIGDPIDEPTEVQTVDECFFIMEKSYWEKIPFSDIEGWHMYAVEQCLRAILGGKKNYVIPSRVWHLSAGVSEDRNYVKIGKEIVQRYGSHFPYINTTVTHWDTQGIKKNITPWIYYVQNKIMLKVRDHPEFYKKCRKVKHIFIKP
ncbi:glycosyltransferase family protein [Weissella confusa]|uniref:Family 2 glycosyl transferase n=1 Tax=Limosilactobacillus reuteri TaxID=1598 RepID=A0A2T5Q3X5_LIMRT|nr:glycosyltransferase [Limosilactobacillus reuteri]MCW3763739.1 glycosyltransferase family protein [Weissella confusa]PTV04115.1 family 2 glycosyl transferase [Limosilactobacillus reuteri]